MGQAQKFPGSNFLLTVVNICINAEEVEMLLMSIHPLHPLQFAFRSRPHCPSFREIRVSEHSKSTSSSQVFLLRSNSNPVFYGGLHRSQFRRCLARVSQSKATSESDVSTAASLRLPTASEVVRDFYDGINLRDLESVESLIGEECVYEDLIFLKPFVGRKAIMEFFKKFTESISSELQFVIDDISNEDTSSAGVTWHLEWRGRPFPFSKGCSFYRLEVSEDIRKIMLSLVRLLGCCNDFHSLLKDCDGKIFSNSPSPKLRYIYLALDSIQTKCLGWMQ